MNDMEWQGGEVSVPPTGNLSLTGLWRVFSSPSRFLEELANRPRVLVPYIVLAAILFAFFYLTADIMVQLQIQMIKDSGREIPPEALNPDMMKWSIMGGGVLAFLIEPLIAAAVAMMFGNFIFGGSARYKQILSIMLYSAIVYAAGLLLMLPIILVKNSMLVSFSAAAFLPDPDMKSISYVALSKIGVFNIWEIIVAGIGLAAAYRFPRNKGYLLSVLSLGLLTVLGVLLTALSSSFS